MVMEKWVLMDNNNVEKYKTVLVGFNKKDHHMIASLLDIIIHYINYKHKDENINFKVTSTYVVVMMYKAKGVTKKQIYDTIDNFHKYYMENFTKFLADNGGETNNDINYNFCEKYIKENGE
jgi:hypothetical protein